MSMEYLGETFDIHTGGIDLVFPHHENEIAQSECATGKQFVKYWLHNEWVMVDGKKMSKSLGNFHTLRSLIELGVDPLAFRLWVLMSHHRSQSNFTLEAVKGAQTALERLHAHFLDLVTETGVADATYTARFMEAITSDFDTPPSIALLWEVVKDTALPAPVKRATLLDFDRVLGLGLSTLKKDEIPEEVTELAQQREAARLAKDFALSDTLRAQIDALGYTVKDTPSGPAISRK
jgi:cysteinyl-tRNA synthetase